MNPYVPCSIIHSGQDLETTELSFIRWLDKEDVVHIYNIILLTLNKVWNTAAICDNMDGPWEYYARWNKSDSKS